MPSTDLRQNRTDPRIVFATRWLATYLTAGDALQAVAARLNLSCSRFRHLFKQETGVAPARYLKQTRLQQAKQLMESSALSVKEVMASVGIEDFSHFVRDFKAAYGLTPSQVRRLSAPYKIETAGMAAKSANR